MNVRQILRDYHALKERQYVGDYGATVILNDLYTALDRADLTDSQWQALQYVYFDDLSQTEAAQRMGIAQPTVNEYINYAIAKIEEVYR